MSNLIDKKTIAKMAKLSHVKIEESQLDLYIEELNKILVWMGQLDEVDVSKVQPLAHPLVLEQVMREDKVEEPISSQTALRNAPESKSGFFTTPKTNE